MFLSFIVVFFGSYSTSRVNETANQQAQPKPKPQAESKSPIQLKQESQLLSKSTNLLFPSYNWHSCCDLSGFKESDYGDPNTNFIFPVTSSGYAYDLFKGYWGKKRKNIFIFIILIFFF